MGTAAPGRSEDRQLTPDEIETLADLVVDESDHYNVLGVERNSSTAEINRAYCRAVDFFHPLNYTHHAESNSVLQWKLSCAYLRIVEAFSTLSSRARRQGYDGALNRQIVGSLRSRQRGLSASNKAKAVSTPGDCPGSVAVRHLPPNGRERRRVERADMRLPLVVGFDHHWQEVTETIDFSALGVKFLLSRPVEPGTLVRFELPMPQAMRTRTDDSVLYAINGYVIQVTTGSGKRLVVAEFV
jgi:hypothetical protein